MDIGFDRIRPIKEADFEKIHAKTVDILSSTGMWFQSEKARNIFKTQGFKVEGETVYFNQNQIEAALKTVPKEFSVISRNPKYDMKVGGDSFAFGPSGSPGFILDYNGEKRVGTREDYDNSLKLTQLIDELDFNRVFIKISKGIEIKDIPLYEILNSIKLTEKPLTCNCVEGIDLLSMLFGISKEKMKEDSTKGKCYAMSTVNPISPLGLSEHESDMLIELCKYGIAVAISPMPIGGLTAPCTLPGILISQNCEILGTLVLSQLVNPGCPVMYSCIGTIADMKTMEAPIAAPETRVIEIASAQIARYYGLPSRGDAGLADSPCCDFQAGAEAAFHFANVIRSGINLLPGLGALGSWNLSSFEKLVLDAELVGYAKRLVKPLEFTEENMAVEEIKNVGIAGSFIAEDHTLDHFRDECYFPFIFTRAGTSNWIKEGKKDAFKRAHEKVQQLLNSYTRPVLDKSIEKDLDTFAAKHFVGRYL